MTIEQAIRQSVPGTGRQIADKVAAMTGNWQVTPNVIYAWMNKHRREFRISVVPSTYPNGRPCNVHYYDVRGAV